MLVNFSNHLSSTWSNRQYGDAIKLYGCVIDLPFPDVDPTRDCNYIANLADEYFNKIKAMGSPVEITVHVMGELNLTYAIVNLLKLSGYHCVASTTNRIVVEKSNNMKEVVFDFVCFRTY